MRADEILERAEEIRPQGPAIRCPLARLSYSEARRRIRSLSAAFRELGLRRGERIALLHRNCHRVFETYFAALHAGAVLVPLNPHLAAGELRSILSDAEISLVVSEPSPFLSLAPLTKRLAGLKGVLWTGPTPPFEDPLFHSYEDRIASGSPATTPESGSEESISHLYYTSGSTGTPKGVILTRRNLISHAERVIPELGIDARTGWAHIAPMFHLADAWAVWAVTAAGGTHSFLPRFEASGALSLLASGEVTMTNLVPTMYHRILREPELARLSFPELRLLLSGGAPIPAETVLRIVTAFRCEFVQTYGLTETSPFLTLSRPDETMKDWPFSEQLRIRCTTGRPMRGVEVRVVGEDGQEVPRDGRSVGEILARGPTVSPGYWNRPADSAAAFREGWLRTGDLAVVGPEGYLTIVDRAKDRINSGGEKIYSLEVENALAAHSEVLESAVIGLPDHDLGESVTAVVVVRERSRVRPEDLIEHCRRILSYYKVPRKVVFVSELPRTGSGKVLKRALREGMLSSPATAPERG